MTTVMLSHNLYDVSTWRYLACCNAPSRCRRPAGPCITTPCQPSTQPGLMMSVGTLQTGLRFALFYWKLQQISSWIWERFVTAAKCYAQAASCSQ